MNPALRRTALHAIHKQMGAKMVDFGGWEMPVEYSGIIAEHLAVRTAAGLFDVSHMGEIEVRGRDALGVVQKVTSNDAARLAVGQAQYSGLMYPQGTFVDDLLVHKISDTHYFLVVNASNQDKDHQWMLDNAGGDAEIENAGDRYTLLAVQGPRALEILGKLTGAPLASLRYYWFTHGKLAGVDCRIGRTGYTGEDGFEIYFDPRHSEKLWSALVEAGKEFRLLPCGLGARNTLRLEAGMALYGHEVDASHTPLEAGLDRIAKLDKGDFLGREALLRQKQQGVRRRLVGLEMLDRGIARDGYPVYREGGEGDIQAGPGPGPLRQPPRAGAGPFCRDYTGDEIGYVTSGSPAPFLKKNIALAYLPAEYAPVTGQNARATISVGIRGRRAAARVVEIPFYKRKK